MSFTTRYIKERIANKKDLLTEQITDRLIIEYYLKDHPEDKSIYDILKSKEILIKRICNGSIWERTRNGFQRRKNYELDEYDEITFDTDKIGLLDNTIVTSGTDAFYHVNKFRDELEALIKVEGLINSYYLQHKEEIDERVKAELKRNSSFKKNIRFGIYDENKHTKDYLNRYGDHGKRLLIKWLNKLNTTTPIEELVEEFTRDVNNALSFFEITEDEGYKEGLKMGISFEGMLLKVIERYSARGEYFMSLYRRSKTDRKGNAYVGH